MSLFSMKLLPVVVAELIRLTIAWNR